MCLKNIIKSANMYLFKCRTERSGRAFFFGFTSKLWAYQLQMNLKTNAEMFVEKQQAINPCDNNDFDYDKRTGL